MVLFLHVKFLLAALWCQGFRSLLVYPNALKILTGVSMILGGKVHVHAHCVYHTVLTTFDVNDGQ